MKGTISKRIAFVVLLAMVTALIGSVSAEAGSVAYKDTIRYAASSDQNSLDAPNNTSNSVVLTQIYNGLVKRDQDNELVPDLAESWELSEDELVWTFHLRKGVKFHNGKEFTARDVKASFDRTNNPDKPTVYTATLNVIAETIVVDDYTVQCRTEKPVGPFLQNLAGAVGALIMDADILEQWGDSDQIGMIPETVNGTGPYKLIDWKKQEYMLLEAHEDYYEGAPLTKYLRFDIIPDSSSRVIAVETGQVDIAVGFPVEEVQRFRALDGFDVVQYERCGMHVYFFNGHESLVTHDPKIRQAILYALDLESLVEALYGDLGETACTSPAPPMYFGYFDMGIHPQDLEKSKELLAEAGYPDGLSIKLMTSPIYNKGVESAEVIKAQLAEVGIDAEIVVLESAAFSACLGSQDIKDRSYEMYICGMGNFALDCDEWRRAYRSVGVGTTKPNGSWYSNAEVDQLLDDAAFTTNVEERLELYKRAGEILYFEEPAGAFINNRTNIYGISDKVQNFHANAGAIIPFHLIQIEE